MGNGDGMAKAIGWFSIGLGLAAVSQPAGMARMMGLRDDETHRDALLAVGLREIASGVGILMRPRPAGWLWARVGGDMMDLGLLCAALTGDDSDKGRVAATTAVILGITATDVAAATQLSRNGADGSGGPGALADGGATSRPMTSKKAGGPLDVVKSVVVDLPADELYRFWRDFENLPRFMYHLESVRASPDGLRSHWRAKAPAGTTVEWDAEVVDDRPGERIAWRSLPGADVPNSGQVRFARAPGGRGTEVRVDMRYDPPGGALGKAVARLFGEAPEQQVDADLRRFKQVMETGEVVRSDGTLAASDRLLLRGERPAQPPAEAPPAPVGA